MIVDDSVLVLEVVGETLRSAGYEVVARNVAIGTGAAILREKPALVLMDVSMPLMSGADISESLRQSAAANASTIVLFSDRPAEELGPLAQRCGAAGFIPKSAPPNLLLIEVGRFLDDRRGSRPGSERRRGRLDEVLVAGEAGTVRWARDLLRHHAMVRGTDSGTEALRWIGSADAPLAALLGTGLLDLTAHSTWAHATRLDDRWRERIVIVEERGHPAPPSTPGMRQWSAREPEAVLLGWLGLRERA